MKIYTASLLAAGSIFAIAAAHSGPSKATAPDFGVDMPLQPTPDTHFPTAETTINEWVYSGDTEAIYDHGWAIWAGLTTPTSQTALGIDNALIYQTWLSPKGIIDLLKGNDAAPELGLRTPLQFHGKSQLNDLMAKTVTASSGMKIDDSIAEVVAYSPAAAMHAYSNKLLFTETLDKLITEGYNRLPPFPKSTVTIKPVYKLISADELNDGLYAMPAWPGTPDLSDQATLTKVMLDGFPSQDWGQCVYVDPSNQGATTANGVDTSCATPDTTNTYGLGDFISIPITDNDIAYFQTMTDGQFSNKRQLAVGDTLLLVGMHVATRESERWTWQTFWWSANPAAPNLPSSADIASHRPASLTPQAGHYAMAVAYSMLEPAQPLYGGQNTGSLVPAYNPHLEAPFNMATLSVFTAVDTPSGNVTTTVGVQSNCMTCHALAGYKTSGSNYAANFYVPLNLANLDNAGMTTDFAWSIPVEAVSQRANTED